MFVLSLPQYTQNKLFFLHRPSFSFSLFCGIFTLTKFSYKCFLKLSYFKRHPKFTVQRLIHFVWHVWLDLFCETLRVL
uniref:Uncharacterized protein n=1 Tax=Pararge aegeria TaxID=116150 RepID=S4PTD7_9NEOP